MDLACNVQAHSDIKSYGMLLDVRTILVFSDGIYSYIGLSYYLAVSSFFNG